MNTEEASSSKDDFLNIENISFRRLTTDILTSKRGSIPRLIESQDVKIKIDKNEKIVDLSTPLFINTISFISHNDKKPKIKVKIIDVNNNEIELSKLMQSHHADNRGYVTINQIVKTIKIKGDKLVGGQYLSEIIVFGLQEDSLKESLDTMISFYNKYDNYKKEINKLIEKSEEEQENVQKLKNELDIKSAEVNDEVATLKITIDEQEKELSELETKVKNEKAELDTLRAEFKNITTEQTNATNNTQILKAEQTRLNTDISKLKSELETLSKRKDLYSESIGGFNKESTQQFWIYFATLLIIIVALFLLGRDAIIKINTLINIYTYLKANNADTSGLELLVMRIPYATIILAVISALTFFAKTLTNRIIEIFSQKRTMIGLSLLAKDIHSSSSSDLDLDSDELYDKREKTKFELLSGSIIGSHFASVLLKRSRVSQSDQEGSINDNDTEQGS